MIKTLARVVIATTPELFLLAGACLLTWGIYDVHPPAAKIAAGVMILFVGWRLARHVPEPSA